MTTMKLLFLIGIGLSLGRPSPDMATRDQKCVDGSPTETGGYTIEYQRVVPVATSNNGHFALDSEWQKAHSTLGSSMHFSFSGSAVPYGEFKCQYGCNGLQGCVSYVGYQNVGDNNEDGGFDCFFFDALINQDVIIATQSKKTSMTHAYNKLCDHGAGQGLLLGRE